MYSTCLVVSSLNFVYKEFKYTLHCKQWWFQLYHTVWIATNCTVMCVQFTLYGVYTKQTSFYLGAFKGYYYRHIIFLCIRFNRSEIAICTHVSLMMCNYYVYTYIAKFFFVCELIPSSVFILSHFEATLSITSNPPTSFLCTSSYNKTIIFHTLDVGVHTCTCTVRGISNLTL